MTNGTASSAQAFCLYFDDVVIVEFSETGNAAQIYDRGQFERIMQSDVDRGACADHTHLKRSELARNRIVHIPRDGWESKAATLLRSLSILPD